MSRQQSPSRHELLFGMGVAQSQGSVVLAMPDRHMLRK